MKQHQVLHKVFRRKGHPGLLLCVNTLSDSKMDVKGIHYVEIDSKTGKAKQERHYIGGKKDLKQIDVLDGMLDGLSGPYFPGAMAPISPLHTLVPDTMDYETHAAIIKIKEEVGSINDYVREKLKYKSDQELAKAMGGEQVDAVAMAIYNIEKKDKGLIIGDQTGIGKGRVAAAIIRYGVVSGRKPVFITEKPNLFSDMYRDLKDIGSASLVPFIVNNKEAATKVRDKDENIIYEPPEANTQNKIIKSNKVPGQYNYVMATYSQFRNEQPTDKKSFLTAISHDNIFILDESHNAGGDLEVSNTARFFYDCVGNTKGTVFLSATFAKRPDNMPLYALKTAMSDAAMSNEDLVDAIKKGGVALQEVISANLVSEGQMIRRERGFEGIEVNYITLDKQGAKAFNVEDKEEEHRLASDRIMDIVRRIIRFQQNNVSEIVEKMDNAMKGEQGEVAKREGTKGLGVDNPPFVSKIFNVLNQILFSIKAEAVADRALQRLKEGKKPLIAFSSTMGAFLEDMKNERGDIVTEGDAIDTDFSAVLIKGLESVLRITKKDAYGNKDKDKIKIEDLPEEAQSEYYSIINHIKNISTGISISPIDVIRSKLESNGYTVSEVTGRKLQVQLEPGSSKGVVLRRKKELVDQAFRAFNDNKVDVLLLNQSGSTGASAHAIVTDKVPLEQVKQRVMIMLQAELDINREVQKRGRINRTGQVIKPIYDYVYSAIPAEKRLAMMAQAKLKSLDANTTSNQKQSEALMKSDDFLNKYGDKIVVSFLEEEENRIFNEEIGDPLKIEDADDDIDPTNAAHRVTGRVALLDTTEQQRFYDEVIENYKAFLQYLVDSGEYDLEVEQMDLQAETIEKEVTVAGTAGMSTFAGNTYLEQCIVNNLRKPLKKIELQAAIQKALNNESAKTIRERLNAEISEHYIKRAESEISSTKEKHKKLHSLIHTEKNYKKLKTEHDKQLYLKARKEQINEGEHAQIENINEKANNNVKHLKRFTSYLGISDPLIYNHQGVDYKAVFLGFQPDYKRPNPYAPSAIKARIAIAGSAKLIQLTLSGDQGKRLTEIIGSTTTASPGELDDIIENWDSYCEASAASRKQVSIYTGNILQAFSVTDSGRLISYTTQSGEVNKGILMPDGWKKKLVRGEKQTVAPLIIATKIVKDLYDGKVLTTSADVAIMKTYQGYRLITNGTAVKKFNWLIKNEDILQYIINYGGFERQSTAWVGDIYEKHVEQIIKLIYKETKATVKLDEQQFELISDLIQTEDDEDTKGDKAEFPKLVEMEIKLFKEISEEEKDFAGVWSKEQERAVRKLDNEFEILRKKKDIDPYSKKASDLWRDAGFKKRMYNIFNDEHKGLGLPATAMQAFETIKNKYTLIKPATNKEKGVAKIISAVKDKTNNFSNSAAVGVNKVEVRSLLMSEKVYPGDWLKHQKTLHRSEADVIEWLAAEVQLMLNKTDKPAALTQDELNVAEAEMEMALALMDMQNI